MGNNKNSNKKGAKIDKNSNSAIEVKIDKNSSNSAAEIKIKNSSSCSGQPADIKNDSDKPETEVVSVIKLLSEKPEETKTNENNKSLDNAVAKKEKKKSVNKAHQLTENKESIAQVGEIQNAKENNSK